MPKRCTRLKNIVDRIRIRQPLLRQVIAEMIGTFTLVIIGLGGNIQAAFLQSKGKPCTIPLEFVWGLALMMAILVSIRGGYGLVNPTFSLSWFVLRRISVVQLFLFILAQVLGAFLGAAATAAVYTDVLNRLGPLTMNGTAVYFVTTPTVDNGSAFLDQIMGAGILLGMSVALVDPNNVKIPPYLHPFLLPCVLTAVLGSYTPNAGSPLNPARDLGPRLFVAMSGAGTEAFTADNYYFWVPIFGPLCGGIVGTLVYELGIGIHLPEKTKKADDNIALSNGEERDHILE